MTDPYYETETDNKKGKGLIWLLVILVLVLCAAAAGYYWLQTQNQTESQSVKIPTAQTEIEAEPQTSNTQPSAITLTSLTPEQIKEGKKNRFKFYKKACSIENYFVSKACQTDKPIQILVIGNLHELDGFNFIHGGYSNNPDINLITFGNMNYCNKSKIENGVWTPVSDKCLARKAVLDNPEFYQNLDAVFYASRFPYKEDKLDTLTIFETLAAANDRIKFITYGPYIVLKEECSTLLNKSGTLASCSAPENIWAFGERKTEATLKDRFKALEGVYIDRVKLLCKSVDNPTSCLMQTPGGIPAMYDGSSLTLEFAQLSGQMHNKLNPDMFTDVNSPTDN